MPTELSALVRRLRRDIVSFAHTYFYIYTELDPVGGIILLISVVSLATSIYSFSNAPTASLIAYTVAVTGLVYQLWQIARKHRRADLRISENTDLLTSLKLAKPPTAEEEDGFKTVSDSVIENSTIIYSPMLNAALQTNQADKRFRIDNTRANEVIAKLRGDKGHIIATLLWYYGKFSGEGKVFVNEKKIAVASIICPKEEVISVFKGNYYTSFLTNDLCTKKVNEAKGGKVTEFFNPSCKFPLVQSINEQRVRAFHDYYFGNHIGVSTIAISSDHYLCFWQQSPKAHFSVGKRVPTGSGSCDWEDLAPNLSMRETLIEGMERELIEESTRKRGLHLNRTAVARTMLLGYFRHLHRGGKPEFIGLSALAKNRIALNPNQDEVEDPSDAGTVIQYPVESFAELRSRVEQLLSSDEDRRSLSVQLWAGLVALREAITERPDIIKSFIGYV